MSAHRKRRRRTVARPIVSCLAAAAAMTALSGCPFSSGEAKSGGQAAEAGANAAKGGQSLKLTLPDVSASFHWAGDIATTGSTLSQVAHGLGTAIDDSATLRTQLEKIAGSDDPYGKALV